MAQEPLVGLGLLIIDVSRSHSDPKLGRTPLDEWSARPLPDKTQHSQETDIHAPGGFRNPSKRGAVDPRLKTARPLGSYYLIQGHFYLSSRIALHPNRFALRQAAQRSPLFQFAVSQGPRVSVQCVAIRSLFTTFKDVRWALLLLAGTYYT